MQNKTDWKSFSSKLRNETTKLVIKENPVIEKRIKEKGKEKKVEKEKKYRKNEHNQNKEDKTQPIKEEKPIKELTEKEKQQHEIKKKLKPRTEDSIINSDKKIATNIIDHNFVTAPNYDPFEEGADPCGVHCDGCGDCDCFSKGSGTALPCYIQYYREIRHYCKKHYEDKLKDIEKYKKYNSFSETTIEEKDFDIELDVNDSNIKNLKHCMYYSLSNGELCDVFDEKENMFIVYDYCKRKICEYCGIKNGYPDSGYEKLDYRRSQYKCENCKLTYECFSTGIRFNCKDLK